MAVNVDSKCWIIALFIRDDGERLVLGDGAYDFKDKQQHFKANAMVNDTVDVQGNDGILIAGQVRRASTQSFDGYIGDATVNQPEIEGLRRDFIGFFSKNHFYKVIYVMPDGTAVKRQRGFIVDAPEVKELWQIHPEYHVALNFEDVNYYNYNENEDGEEVYSQIVELAKAGAATGGLIWDEYGAVGGQGATYNKTVTGTDITITDAYGGSIQSLQIDGDTYQSGTPTPSVPVPIQTVSGRQVITINGSDSEINLGKNIFDKDNPNILSGYYLEHKADNNTQLYTATGMSVVYVEIEPSTTYTISKTLGNRFCIATNPTIPAVNTAMTLGYQDNSAPSLTITSGPSDKYLFFWVLNPSGTTTTLAEVLATVQVEKGSTATTYAAYINSFGKNLFGAKLELGGINSTDGSDIAASNRVRSSYVSGLTGGGTYSISSSANVQFALYAYSATAYISGWGGTWLSNPSSFTLPATATRLRILCRHSDNSSITVAEVDGTIQIESGSSDTTYADHIGANGQLELCKIGDYQDYIYKQNGDWYLHKETAKIESYNSEAITTDYISSTGELSAGAVVYYGLGTPTNTQITNTALINQLETVAGTSLQAGNNTVVATSNDLAGILEIEYIADNPGGSTGYEWEAGGGSATAIVSNDSIDYIYPVITIPGPATDPVIENSTTNQTISYSGSIGDGQTLVIDNTAQTALLNGLNVVSGVSGSWLSLAPGNNQLTYTTDNADTPNAILEWSEVVG